MMHGLGMLAAGPLVVCVASATASITLDELIERPDLLPSEVTALREFRFGGGDRIAEGQTMRVVELSAAGLTVDNGKFMFVCKPEETDLLSKADAYVSTLSEAQRELTLDMVLEDSTLWPTTVALGTGMEFTNGARVDPGAELPLRAVNGTQLDVYSSSVGSILAVAANDTDLVRRARELVETPADERRPHFSRAVESTLSGDGPDDLSNAEFILLYRGSAACPRCSRFSPKLKKAYGKLKKNHDNFEVVFLSEDRSEGEFNAHIRDKSYPFAVVEYDKLYAAADARTREGRLMPVVYLVRPDGSVIDHTDVNGRRQAEDVLKTLERELKG